MLQKIMLKRHQQLQQKISSIEKELADYPDGKLICCRQGHLFKWYLKTDGRKTYIPKARKNLAEQLAAKKYLTCLLADLNQEKAAAESYLNLSRKAPSAAALLTKDGRYDELLKPFFKTNPETDSWANASYEKNLKHPEHLTHKTSSGHTVRSKSEAMIDLSLYAHRIPFRYECALPLGGVTLYPDFTILHPVTGEVFYWEHFGTMDDPAYRKNALSKLQIYSEHGICPALQLIITCETRQHPLSPEAIEKTIRHYFL